MNGILFETIKINAPISDFMKMKSKIFPVQLISQCACEMDKNSKQNLVIFLLDLRYNVKGYVEVQSNLVMN